MTDGSARLRVQRRGGSQLFDRARVVIGREPDCDVQVSEPSASRRHAVVQRDGDRWTLIDTSTHGSWVDGVRVDRLALGPAAVAVRLGSPSGEELQLSVLPAGAPVGPGRPVPPPVPGTAVHQPAAPPPPPPPPPVASSPRAPGAAWWDSEPVVELPATAVSTGEPAPSPYARVVSIGRDPANDLVLDDPKVSRRHARLELTGGTSAILHDLDSFNGTYVNGVPLRGSVELTVGAEVGIGDRRFRWDGAQLVAL